MLETAFECMNSIQWIYNNSLLCPIITVAQKTEVADNNHTFPHLWTAEYLLICSLATGACIICNENTCSEKIY
jgi:hypothetical protein